jgi:hypothetical protein
VSIPGYMDAIVAILEVFVSILNGYPNDEVQSREE